MRLAQKRKDPFLAFRLGEYHPLEKELIRAGKIRQTGEGCYEVFSQEARDGEGEQARAGDYIRIDSQGFPYPNAPEYFENNCEKIGENLYQPLGRPVQVWFSHEPICDFVDFLIREKRLFLDFANESQYFRAVLWGAPLSAPKDAALVAYAVHRNPDGRIIDVEFNFVARDELDRTYEWCSPDAGQ